MKLYIGADHRGFELKEDLKVVIAKYGEVIDVGADSMATGDDFVDYAKRACTHLVGQPDARAILICGSGIGMAIAANKIPGIRAAVGHDVDEIRISRHDEDINVLCLSADTKGIEDAQEFVEAFLTTAFSIDERYSRRIAKIKELETHA
jgi:ribose 5-phosphate isomerase B